MAEEGRFFLRTAVYSAVITVVYWFWTYDAIGTVMLAFTAFATGFAVAAIVGHVPATLRRRAAPPAAARADGDGGDPSRTDERLQSGAGAGVKPRPRSTFIGGRIAGTLNRIFGLAEDRDVVADPPLAGGPERLPTASLWPFVGGFAALLIGMGIVYGSWLLLPGIAVAVAAGIGWIAQETRRT